MVTWWKQPGKRMIKRVTKNTSSEISPELAEFEIALFLKCGWKVIDHPDKTTAIKQ